MEPLASLNIVLASLTSFLPIFSYFYFFLRLFLPCSHLPTTCSNATTAQTGVGLSSRLDKVLSDSPVSPDNGSNSLLSDNYHHRLPSQSSEHMSKADEEEEEEDDDCIMTEFYEDEQKEDTEVRNVLTTAICSPSSPPSLMTSPTSFGVSNDFSDKRPLWAAKPPTAVSGVSFSTSMGGVSPLTGIATAPTPVHSSIPLSRPLGVRNVVFQSTPTTGGSLVNSGKNMAVQVPMMYQLATSPGLLAPLLTMVPPTAAASLAANALPKVPKLISASTGLENIYGNNKMNNNNILNSDSDKIFEKELHKKPTEPTTGQTLPYSDNSEYGSACSSPAASVSTVGSPAPRTLASIPHSELTSDQIELKGFAEDFKTRRIKLGFTQGSVGQSLAEKGYSNFAQSTISRFEQMQLSPSNAATIRVVLEQWLLEAESPDSAPSGPCSGANLPMMASRKRKKRAVFTPHTKSTLDTCFLQNPRPNRQAIEEMSQQLELLPEEVRVWFCNKRQKSKPGVPQYPVRSLSLGNETSTGNRSPHSTTPSPSPSCDGALGLLALKRRSASPPSHKTPFTIEELSKSSSSSTYTTTPSPSPIRVMGQSFSPISLVQSTDARAKILPMVFSQQMPMLTSSLGSPFFITNQIAKTKA